MERKNKPSNIPVSPNMPQPTIELADNVLTARLPSGDSCVVNLYGATVTSWKTSHGTEKLFLSKAAALDGSKPIRGGIPLVFPVFGPAPKDHSTSALPQHGFARNSYWEFLGKSSSESMGKKSDDNVKLDFGLGSGTLAEGVAKKWPYEFALVYSITLGKEKLECQMHVQNKGKEAFEFQCLFHTYLQIKDISKTTVSGLASSQYIDKVRQAKTFQEEHEQLPIEGETDRVYTPALAKDGNQAPIVVNEGGKPSFVVTRDSLPNVTVWNGWEDKIKGMGDFEPKDGWKRYICIEPGTVLGWTKLEGGDAWEGQCTFESKL